MAAEAIFGRLGVPERVGTLVSGESLVNDGTGLVAFGVAVAAVVSGAFSVWEAGLSFLLIGGAECSSVSPSLASFCRCGPG